MFDARREAPRRHRPAHQRRLPSIQRRRPSQRSPLRSLQHAAHRVHVHRDADEPPMYSLLLHARRLRLWRSLARPITWLMRVVVAYMVIDSLTVLPENIPVLPMSASPASRY
ncbi:hypothetical protein VPH35_082262 [Triticum aestivum]